MNYVKLHINKLQVFIKFVVEPIKPNTFQEHDAKCFDQ